MYHIPEDKRAKKSAMLLADAILECLNHKEFTKISVSDLNKKSYVSRSTFYRLFDNTYDVLSFLCDNMYEEIFSKLNDMSFASVTDLMTAFNREIMSRNSLLDALAKNNMTDVLHSTHIKYFNFFTPYFKDLNMHFSKRESTCALSILSGALCSYIAWWIKNGKKETPEELTAIVSKCFYTISKVTV